MQVPACSFHQLQERASAVIQFLHVVPPGISLETALSRDYWRNAWKLLETKPRSTIDLIADDNAWEATVRILSAKDGDVQFRIITEWHAEKVSKAAIPEGYRVEHMTGKGWRALDPVGVIVVEGVPVEAEAVASAQEHATAPAAKKSRKNAA